jgi:hypothetical protein
MSKEASVEVKSTCGIVMPISTIDNCTEAHWGDVLEILTEAIEDAGLEPNLVSNADDVGIIQKRIIQNLYENPIVVCDVSGKNPNVMFELGLRLAFDKPTIIIKDDKTAYSFDTAPIEHLEYPRDLRFSRIVEFKHKLAEKIKGTQEKAATDPMFSTFLKNFGEFTVAKLEKKEVSGQEYILEELKNIRRSIQGIDLAPQFRKREAWVAGDRDVCLKGMPDKAIEEAVQRMKSNSSVKSVAVNHLADGHKHVVLNFEESVPSSVASSIVHDLRVKRKLKLVKPIATKEE